MAEALSIYDLELGMHCMETAEKNGMEFVITDGELYIQKQEPEMPGFHFEQAKLVSKMLKQRAGKVKEITSDFERTRKTLCEAQQALFEANNSVMVQLDLVDRLEKCMRQVWPEFKECINGKDGCREGSVVFCTACARVMDAPAKEASDGG